MNRKELFKQTLENAKKESFTYIGTGNINGQVLIIGKEVAIDKKNQLIMSQYIENQNIWAKDFDKDIWDIPLRDIKNHSPICPYKDQYMKLNTGENWGTSRT